MWNRFLLSLFAFLVYGLSQSALASDDSHCSEPLRELVGKHFGLESPVFLENRRSPDRESGEYIVEDACKPWPGDSSRVIAAFGYELRSQEYQILIALVDQHKRKVISSYRGGESKT